MVETEKRVGLVTVSSTEEARKIAGALVERKLAACVNIAPGLTSIYMWQGRVCDEPEHLMIIKTSAGKVEQVIACVRELHSYDTPEIIFLPIKEGLKSYLDWIDDCLRD